MLTIELTIDFIKNSSNFLNYTEY